MVDQGLRREPTTLTLRGRRNRREVKSVVSVVTGVLAVQAWGLGFRFQHPQKSQAWPCTPVTPVLGRGVKTGGLLGLQVQ